MTARYPIGCPIGRGMASPIGCPENAIPRTMHLHLHHLQHHLPTFTSTRHRHQQAPSACGIGRVAQSTYVTATRLRRGVLREVEGRTLRAAIRDALKPTEPAQEDA